MVSIEKLKYLIVGQGLVGTWMSYHLEAAGLEYKIVHDPTIPTATSVASGVINPVTGRRIVQTWMIESILPFAVNAYQQMANKLAIDIIQTAPVLLIHPSQQMKESFEYRLTHENMYLFEQDPKDWDAFFNMPFGTGGINDCYWMDLNKMTKHWNLYLAKQDKCFDSHFDYKDIQILEEGVQWKNIIADTIVFCDGIGALQNPYFNALPFAPNKGEALIIKVPGLPNKHMYKNNVSIVPWEDDLFWVGSSYEWSFEHNLPTQGFKEKMIQSLDQILQLPYTIVDHITGIRPANTQRRPFVGKHPLYPSLAICNGMGTKGCSLAPYFTKQLLDHLELGAPIEPEANVQRFESILHAIKEN